jgi:hypothetical protein
MATNADKPKPLDLRSLARRAYDRDVSAAEIEVLDRLRAEAVKAAATIKVFELVRDHVEKKVGIFGGE